MRSRGDAGNALVEFVWLSALLLVPLAYVVIAVFQVQGAVLAASTAAREAGREYAAASGDDTARHTAAQRAAGLALADQHIDVPASSKWLTTSTASYPGRLATRVVRVDVHLSVPVPLVGGWLGKSAAVRVNAHHDTALDTYAESP